mmetsp:Transcript_6900/g.12669  ORF Transcript_6900/g.12669 Transcript_6900/m.12669 type:complete len:223 (-) Transcript_6900:1834-2502(-)
MVHFLHHLLLAHDVLGLLRLQHDPLAHALERIRIAVPGLGEIHRPERALPEDAQLLQIRYLVQKRRPLLAFDLGHPLFPKSREYQRVGLFRPIDVLVPVLVALNRSAVDLYDLPSHLDSEPRPQHPRIDLNDLRPEHLHPTLAQRERDAMPIVLLRAGLQERLDGAQEGFHGYFRQSEELGVVLHHFDSRGALASRHQSELADQVFVLPGDLRAVHVGGHVP